MQVAYRHKLDPNFYRVQEFPLHDVWVLSGILGERFEMEIDGEVYEGRVNRWRFDLFRDRPYCEACGLAGQHVYLECRKGTRTGFFNFYARDQAGLVLMTVDHIFPRCLGGRDAKRNLAVLCQPCNILKSHYILDLDSVRELRELLENPEHLPVKQLRDRIARARLMKVNALTGL